MVIRTFNRLDFEESKIETAYQPMNHKDNSACSISTALLILKSFFYRYPVHNTHACSAACEECDMRATNSKVRAQLLADTFDPKCC